MNNVEEELTLKVRSRPTTTVSIEIPTDTLESLNQVALHQDMPLSIVLKFYIGQGLRQDLTKFRTYAKNPVSEQNRASL